MDSIIHQLGQLDISPVFINLFATISQPFVHSFQANVSAFLPYMKSLISNEPGLIGGMIFILFTYSFAVLVQNTKKARVVITNKKRLS